MVGGVTSLILQFLRPVEKKIETDAVAGSATACWHPQLLAQT